MELYNELTDLTLVKQTPDEEVAIPTSAEIEPDNEKPASIPAALLEESPDDTPPAAPMVAEAPSSAPVRRKITPAEPILTIDSRSTVENEDAREASAWHEIHNAYRTRRILSGHLGGIEQTAGGKTIATVEYNGFRIVIPLKEMMIQLGDTNGQSASAVVLRQNKLLGNMLGAEIDFVVRGIDSGKVMRLAMQVPLSCAEIIQCLNLDVRTLSSEDAVMEILYTESDLTCDNFPQKVYGSRYSREVIEAVAGLYLRKQIILDTY